MIKKVFIPLISLLLFFGISCKKDTDTTSPSIAISAPAALTSYNVFDTIMVTATVSDEKQISSIQIKFLNSVQVPVLPSISVSANSNPFTFTRPLVLSDIHLNSGTYFINVFASDGSNDANAFREVIVIEAPLEVERYVVVSRPGSGIVRVDTIDPQFTIGLLSQWNGDHSASEVNSYDQQIVVGGGNVSAALSIDAEFASVLWSVSNQNISSLPYFKDVRFSGDHLLTYITNEDRQIRGYNKNGSVSFTAMSSNIYRPQKVLGHGSLVIVELEDIVPPMRRLGLYWKASGVLFTEYMLNMEVVFMYPRLSDRLIIFGNQGGQSVVEERNLDNGSFWSLTTLPLGALNEATAISSTSYLLAHENGLYRYDYSTNNQVQLVGGINALQVAYDRVNSMAIVAVDSELRFYNANTGAFLTSVGLQDEAEAIGVLYNK